MWIMSLEYCPTLIPPDHPTLETEVRRTSAFLLKDEDAECVRELAGVLEAGWYVELYGEATTMRKNANAGGVS